MKFDYDRLADSLKRSQEAQTETRLGINPNAVQEVVPHGTPTVRLECKTNTSFRSLQLNNDGQSDRYWLRRAKEAFNLTEIAFNRKGRSRRNASAISWVGTCQGVPVMITARWIN